MNSFPQVGVLFDKGFVTVIESSTDMDDSLTIYDGSNEQSTKIETLMGNLGSFAISSSGNSLFVRFKSHFHFHQSGFLATIHYGNPLYRYQTYFKLAIKSSLYPNFV